MLCFLTGLVFNWASSLSNLYINNLNIDIEKPPRTKVKDTCISHGIRTCMLAFPDMSKKHKTYKSTGYLKNKNGCCFSRKFDSFKVPYCSFRLVKATTFKSKTTSSWWLPELLFNFLHFIIYIGYWKLRTASQDRSK